MTPPPTTPPQPSPFPKCQNDACAKPTLGPVLLCQGKGKEPLNFGRWYQVCTSCKLVSWHGRRLGMDQIPEEIQIRSALKRSLADQPSNGLDCASPNCRGDGGPRKANRLCDNFPQLCKTCCRLLGLRCVVHKVALSNARPDLSTGRSEPSSEAPAPADTIDTSAATSTDAATSVSSRGYARPLPSSFAKAYVATHQKNAASNEKVAMEVERNDALSKMVVVLLWLKSRGKAARLNVVSRLSGSIVLAEHPVITQKLAGAETVSVFRLAPQPEWIEQELNVPIPLISRMRNAPRILCRLPSLEDSDCLDLDEELAVLGVPVPKATRPVSASDGVPRKPTHPRVDASLDTNPSMPKRLCITPNVPFPRVYTCEMANGFTMVEMYLRTGFPMDDAFDAGFPGSVYVDHIFQEHYDVYKKGLEADIIREYQRLGYTSGGKWIKLSADKRIMGLSGAHSDDAPTTTGSSSKTTGDDLDVIDLTGTSDEASNDMNTASAGTFTDEASADDDPIDPAAYQALLAESVIYSIDVQRFIFPNGKPEVAWTTSDRGLSLYTTCSPRTTGSTKQVYLGYMPSDGAVVMKSIVLPDGWHAPWLTAEAAIWAEAYRLPLCTEASLAFQELCTSTSTSFHSFQVLPTKIFVVCGKYQIGQAFVEGPYKILAEREAEQCRQTLAAFSHFTYHASDHQMIHIDFQGYHTQDRLVIFDCVTHICNTNDLGPFITGSGTAYIENFPTIHTCNRLCQSIGLPSV